MNLKRETILDFYTHKKKKIFCQIKVQPSKSQKIKYTCRSLTQEQWTAFDKELEKLLDGMVSSKDADSELLGKFMIGPKIEVKVQKSKLSLKYLCKCLGAIGDNEKDFWGKIDDSKDVALVLECLIVMEIEPILTAPEEIQEYEPLFETSSPDGKLTAYLMYQPYTPSKRQYCADGIATIDTPVIHSLNDSEDTYSPMPLFEISTAESLNEVIPQYKPAPIKENGNPKKSGNDNVVDIQGDVFVQKSKEEYIPEGQKITTFDIPAYVPTPIDWSQTSKALKAFHEKPNSNLANKNLRRRSKTIDAIPKDLASNMFCKQKSEYSVTQSKEKFNYKSAKCDQIQEKGEHISREIDDNNWANETDDEAVSAQKYRPSKLKSKKKHRKEKEIAENNLKTQGLNEYTNFDESTARIDDLPEIVADNYNKKCRKRCKTLDSIPRALALESDKSKLNSIPEENNITKTTKEKKIETNTVKHGKEEKLDKNCTKVTSLGENENIPEKSKKLLMAKETHLTASSANDFEDEKNVNTSTSSTTDDSPPKAMRNKEKSKESYLSDTYIRRSGRSPSKPIRYIEEIGTNTSSNRQKKRKTHKSSPKNKELFGTDDDDDDDDDDYFENNGDRNKNISIIKTASVCEIPLKQKSSSSSSSSPFEIKKRKRDKNSDCEQEKRDISKWLSKNKTSAFNLDASTFKVSKKSTISKSPSKKRTKEKEIQPESTTPTPGHFNMPSKVELEEMRNKAKLTQKENEKFKAELDKMKAPPPKEVENLSLQDMSLNDILHTFSNYKNELDEIYQKYYKRDYIKGHDGINHCFVIRLLQPDVQLKMLQKLTDVYSDEKNTTQATLYANALLPEWVIRVYMEKFNFTRQEAINQIKAQDDYRLHMEQENDISSMFD